MAVHAAPHGTGTSGAPKAHHSSARFYILIFFILLIVTIAEVLVAQEPFLSMFAPVPGGILIPLLVLAAAKFFMIASFYMHLKQDSRVFTAFFVVGLVLALGMWGTFMGLFTAHYREPFDQIAWRESLARESGSGSGTTGTASGGGH